MLTTMAKTADGVLRGRVEDGLTVFRGVRYATCERFGPPRRVPTWSGERDATVDGPIAPQRPSRLEPVMGAPEPHEQGEDCLNLTITTPGADDRARPVLVWFHGGAWISGAGSWKWYGGHRLAQEGDVVVVSVSYRLGVLGYLRAPGISEGNLGLADQLAALRWVHQNIAAFGGDPDAVTVAGQSAGGHTVRCLLGMPAAENLFRRAILQSSPGFDLINARTVERAAQRFLTRLGQDPRAASVPDILDAQSEVARAAAGRFGLKIISPFCPIPGVGPLPDEADWTACLVDRAPTLDVIIGTTAREMSAFYTLNPALRRLRRVPAVGPVITNTWEHHASDTVCNRPTRRLAARLNDSGARVRAYRFDYAPPASPFGATHCIELPFLFGTAADWATAPMLAGADPNDIDTLGRHLRAAWLGFIRTGTPATEPPWPQYTADSAAVRHWRR
ncbi:carboxylesterase family protein [Amycolatopsis carbonis]|uniref:Carboxylic ester hydrolase n=1 Tax=Amycolatopsis carbonis TaxID=715471 RepID=A0A9Y2MV90_9PSEU|nr:carboxylesterase family protein [Amycolatopsis sp. 2-15]WIX76644.1 carboxylesterase family protein [Amycolatopsis sp. 2-15]